MVKQGDIIKVNLNPKQGHEQQGYRPYICLSHNIISQTANSAIFAPISNTLRDYPFYIPLVSTSKTAGKVLLDQLVAIDYNARDHQFVEKVNEELLEELLSKARALFQKSSWFKLIEF